MLIVGIVASRSDSRGFFAQDVFSYLGLCVSVPKFIYSNYRLHLLSTVRPELLLPNAHTDCQVKKARVKSHSVSRPADARPLDSSLKSELVRTSLNLMSRASP